MLNGQACSVTMPYLAEGYVGVHHKVMLCGCRQLVCRGIGLWIQGTAAPYVITEIMLPAHLQMCVYDFTHYLLWQEHGCNCSMLANHFYLHDLILLCLFDEFLVLQHSTRLLYSQIRVRRTSPLRHFSSQGL